MSDSRPFANPTQPDPPSLRTAGSGAGRGIEISWEQGAPTVRVAAVHGGASADFHLGGQELDALIGRLQAARREAFGPPPPTAAVIEIIEPGRATDDTMGGSIVVPAEVRINGHRVLTTDGGVTVHEMTAPPREMARVTMTLCARRVTIAAEGDL